MVLCVVALLQIYRAHNLDQTPWKGGGFGMFSTVDTTGARFLRAYLAVNGVYFPVTIPERLKRAATKTRAVPTGSNLRVLTEALSGELWVVQDFGTIAYRERKAAHAGHESWQRAQVSHLIADELGANGRSPAPRKTYYPRFRTLREGEAVPAPEDLVSPEEVRVELWKYHFDSDPARLTARLAVVQSKTVRDRKNAAVP